jgi:S-adenosylmethionine:tRNA ribosyltransferase-isomerase
MQKKKKRRICAIGTTAMRGLESAVSSQQTLNTHDGWTNKFIFPPYEFSLATAMITNFHLPKSTLLMMVSAFMGHDLMKKSYKEAILEGYKFYSYGDAMLII